MLNWCMILLIAAQIHIGWILVAYCIHMSSVGEIIWELFDVWSLKFGYWLLLVQFDFPIMIFATMIDVAGSVYGGT